MSLMHRGVIWPFLLPAAFRCRGSPLATAARSEQVLHYLVFLAVSQEECASRLGIFLLPDDFYRVFAVSHGKQRPCIT